MTQPACTCATLLAKRLEGGELRLDHRAGCPQDNFLSNAVTQSDHEEATPRQIKIAKVQTKLANLKTIIAKGSKRSAHKKHGTSNHKNTERVTHATSRGTTTIND
jgi:hypothetical protein